MDKTIAFEQALDAITRATELPVWLSVILGDDPSDEEIIRGLGEITAAVDGLIRELQILQDEAADEGQDD